MGSYSDWIISRRELYQTAITNAYAAHQASSANDYESGYDLMAADSEIAALIPPTNTAAFYGASPNASEAQITTLQTWLQANPTAAGKLNLALESDASSETGRKALGGRGNVGTERRKWKGSPLYTFANGVLIGKDGKIIAALGTNGGGIIDGFGTDTLMYFDGIPFSKGSGLPGAAVFGGDVVVSGSIQGTNGIVIIDDVIQLERGFANPAGIGVDDAGKIRLRHRGEGFLDLVDEIETAKTTATDDAKLWVGAQNTSSVRWGSSLIPNSNFSNIENSGSGGSYTERPAGVISVGTNSNIISYTSGIVSFNPNAQGIAFQAIPITADRYTVRIRYKGSANESINATDTAEGLFLGFHETTDEDLDDKLYVYDNATPAANHEGSSVYTTNTIVKYPTSLRSADSSTYDGAPITTSYVVKSYAYSPSSTAKNASLVIWARNFDLSGTPLLDIDYVVMTEAPQTASEITSLINTATAAIDTETGSEIIDAQMGDKSKWAVIGGASLVDNADGGDGGTGDAAIEVTCSSSGDGITSTSIDCVSDTYLVGMRIKTSSGTTNVSIAGIETVGPYYNTLGATDPKLAPGVSNYRTKSITLQEIDALGQPTGTASATKSVTTAWKTLIGTYQPNKLHPTTYATGYTTPTSSTGSTFILPGKFSLAIQADSAITFVVDYVYAAVQGSSVNVAQELANSAYGDSQTFVTSINDLLIKESGSIVNNSSMAMPSTVSDGPAGYRCRSDASGAATISTQTAASGDKSVRVVAASGQRTLISPTFLMDSADKYSIGISAKAVSSAVNMKIKVAYTTAELTGANAEYVTIADSKQSSDSDILTAGVTETSALIIDPDDDEGGSDTTDWNVGTSYENILVTWTAVANQKTASIIIEADGDFEIDYILVKEQVVSFSLADTQAQARRDEAIAQAEGFTTALGETMASESGSMIQNASFGSWYLNGSSKHRPHGWYTTRGASNPLRVIPVTESTDATTQAKENVENINQTGSALKFTPSANGGILSKLTQLPAGSSWTDPADSSVITTTGTYTFALRIRLSSAEPVGVRIYAHEYYDYVTAAETHVIGNASNTYGTATHEGTSAQVKSFTSSEGNVARIGPINVTTSDVTPGYDPDYAAGSDEWADVGDDRYVEYIPVDGSETDGDIDDTASTFATWYTIAGSYTPNASTKQVSFEVLIDGDPDVSDGNIPDVYIDYVNLVPQPFDTDFAQTLATSVANERAETAETFANAAAEASGSAAQQALASLFAAADSEAAQMRDNINQAVLSEQGSIMYNSAFAYQESFGAGINTGPLADSGNSGSMTPTVTSVNATSSGQYKIILQDTGSSTTSSGGTTVTTPAKYKVQKYLSSSWTTLKDNANNDLVFNSSISATPISNTSILVTWNQVTAGGATDFWTWTTTAYQRPIGYRLARVNHSTNANSKKNLTYHAAPGDGSAGGAKIAIMEDGTGYQDLATTSYSLLCPPVLVPSDSQATTYQVAAKVKVGTSDTQFLAIRIHEIFDYFDQDTYVTFVASDSSAKDFMSPSDATPASNTYNVTTSKGIASTHVESDVYRFDPSATDVPLRSVFSSWAGYDSTHIDYPVGRTQDVTVIKLSEYDSSPGSIEPFGNSFVTIGGGFDTSKDCKMFVVELIFSSVANNSSTIIDYIHVAQSTIGASAASDIANSNIATSLADYTTTVDLGSSIGTYLTNNSYPGKDGTVTDADLTSARTDLEETIQGLNTDGFVQPNQRFANQVGLTGDASHKIPEGYSLHRYINVADSSNMGHATDDRRKMLNYPAVSTHGRTNANPVIMVQESTFPENDYNFGLVTPYIPANNLTAHEGISFAMKLKLAGDTAATLYVRAHQIFSDPSSTNGLDGNVATCVIQDDVYDFSDSGGISYSATDITEATDNDRCPDAAFFRGVDFHITQAQAKNSSNSPTWNASVSTPLGTVWECNLIDLTDETDTSATTSKSITSSYKVIGGSFPIHESAVAISLEFYVIGVGASDYVVFDDFSVDGMHTFVDQAVLKSVDRVIDIVEEIEEERVASLTNVIQNPSFKQTERVDTNGRYQVPRSWRYTGAAGDLWGIGYRSTPTGVLVNPDDLRPRASKYATIANIGHRDITSQGSNSTTKYFLNHGAASKPFAVADDLYEWEIKLTLDNGGIEGVRLFVLEYDTSSPKPDWIKPHTVRAVGSNSKDMGLMDSISSNRNLVTATRHFCLHYSTADALGNYSYSSSTSDNGVVYHSGTDISVAANNITQIKNGSTTTLSSNVRYLAFNDNGGTYTWSGNYTPTSTAKYAAVWICFYGSALNKNILHHVEMLADKVSSNAITARTSRLGLSDYANRAIDTVLSSRFTTSSSTLYGGFTKSMTVLSWLTDPSPPSIDLEEISVGDGYSSFNSTSETSGNRNINKFHSTLIDTTGDGDENAYMPTRIKYSYENASNASSYRTKQGGLVYSQAVHYNKYGVTGGFSGEDNHVRGVSHFKPVVSEYIGTYQGKQLWFKSHATDPESIVFYESTTTNRWGIGFTNNEKDLRFYYNGATIADINDDGTTGNLNFTGQHRCEDIEDSLSSEKIGLIVCSVGRYSNLTGDNKPTINESLPVVELSTTRNQKSAFGVLSDREDENETRTYTNGNFRSHFLKNGDVDRLIINSLGEGAIWVCNINGNLENGDYITTCEIAGYGMAQDDDLLHNYTVAKITQDCIFELDNPLYDCVEFEHEAQTYRKAFVGCTYHCG